MGISNRLKKIVGISLFVFWSIVTAFFVAGLVFYQKDSAKPDSASLLPILPNSTEPLVLNSQEIAKHNFQSDCWMIIDGKVYNFTSYLGAHPGEVSSMLPYCGRDGSQGFATKDKKNPQVHSGYANSLLGSYYIGNINQTINKQSDISLSQSPAPSDSAPTPTAPVLSAAPVVSDSNITLNAQEVAKHSTTGNCWMIINGNVYDITGYFGAHPGGVSVIVPYCGKDGTQAFQGLPHSSYAKSLLAGYFIGALNQTASAQQIQQNVQNSAQITPPPRGGRDNEEEDD